jgi:sarcosine oxidase
VEVRTVRGVHRAARVIIAAGSWMRPLAAQLGLDLPLTVRKELVMYMAAERPAEFEIGRFPIYIHRLPGTSSGGAGFPLLGSAHPKFLFHAGGPQVEPEDVDRTPDPALLARTRAAALDVVRGLTGDVVEAIACRYTMTPDEDFLIDRHPEHRQIVLASPCSGHGFKFGSIVGKISSDLALRGETAHEIGRFRLRW